VPSIRKRGKSWAAELYVNGIREYASFKTKAEAALWALQREAELTGARLPDRTLDDALVRYSAEKAPSLGGAGWAVKKLANLRTYPLAKRRLTQITGPDIAAWRDARLGAARLRGAGVVGPATVNRELNLIRSVLEAARKDWGWLDVNPMRDVSRPKNPKARRRRITEAEVLALCKGLGYASGPPVTLSHRVALAFLLALETAMRGGEIVRIRWADVGERSVRLPRTKNGDERSVPLSLRAREILALMPRGEGPVFGLTDAQRESLFRKGRERSKVANVRFHDSRAEAIWRLSKKLDVLELARVVGHRNIGSLLAYYNATADELAEKLG
jgi:integrase